MNTSTDTLWGGRLTEINFDPVGHSLTLHINVFERFSQVAHELVCVGVSEFRFNNSIPLPWSYAEVTEVNMGRTTVGRCVLEVVLWSEDCELVCTCDAITIT
jgi:hypothetical protein